MKCLKCGHETSKSYKVDFDGVEKEIAYCQKCLMDVLKESVPLKKTPSPSEDSMRKKRHLSFDGEMVIFVETPLRILEEMFGKIWSDQERENFENERKITFLERKLNEAIKNEDYRKANRLKQLILQIKNKTVK
ncbi:MULTISPECIES: UvrB/UvrC motif-containing protein [unclassified Thermotoga]|uniref:UvrB/UvrC motif-containing protein n=1 Tax=unclassified Thermotoga TaxID=2631113 RepID=UPI0005412086|nr:MULTISPECIES: UvrB/UvrC motif-containing protein [unclassified Thermotoga]AIY88502.1 UvrB/UvrC protein [Thermotoga sp. Cell2]KHC94670.1 UvrB/UvrC protein [Thermotoga sp. TBGT1765]KHC94920.1 UvrB/UvrC protein [Thermotoga sp. TBGT1766]KHC95171.1 UvrB/UvrC protein [Thermotoga sp. Xyl54]